ncbi:GNAT family N-acetyltransferase [Nocardioides sp. URHA0020]|uniref:GNAT family N-acetyltransferase n=1 Tax=Nocardioides sp. URHA0020 TaxID=1380392 RepID=UPI00048F19D3|nr:GNAT family N-acetyltransferase [Nocardioides sp. URHA0020]
MTPTLRAAVPADAEAGAALHVACWREAYTPYADPALLAERLATPDRFESAWRRQLVDGPPRVLAEADGELVGFAVVGDGRDPDAPTPRELYAIYLRAAWWGTGLGQQLWDAVRPEQACSLWVLEDNARARRFYARNGFVADGSRELYEGLGTWEIRMVRP